MVPSGNQSPISWRALHSHRRTERDTGRREGRERFCQFHFVAAHSKEEVLTTRRRRIRGRRCVRHRWQSHHGLGGHTASIRDLKRRIRVDSLVPGTESLGLVAPDHSHAYKHMYERQGTRGDVPRMARPVLTASLPSQTMQTTGPTHELASARTLFSTCRLSLLHPAPVEDPQRVRESLNLTRSPLSHPHLSPICVFTRTTYTTKMRAATYH